MLTHLRPAIVLTLVLAVLTGLLYPLAITGAAQILFPAQANGSQVVRNGTLLGSALIGEAWTQDKYFHGRPSAAKYDASASSGSNLGPSSKRLAANIAAKAAALGGTGIPADLVTASGSGLDPDISPAGALFQVPRVARARGLSEDAVRRLVIAHTDGPELGILGEAHVNVLALNLALDELKP
ncbi:MAG: potassium-transporting ATPase subunit KdpC [Devosia sp.]